MNKQQIGRRIKRYLTVTASAAVFLSSVASAHAMINIPGEEITSRKPGTSFDSSHVVAIGIKKHVDPSLSIQGQINAVNAQGGAAIMPHPLYQAGDGAPGFSLSTLKAVRGHIGTELTDSMTDVKLGARYWGWDYGAGYSPLVAHILDSHRVSGFRNPDTNILSVDSLRSSNVVRAKSLSQASILAALRRGDFYAVRARNGGTIAKKKSFPIPVVNLSTGTITMTARAGYSVRYFSAGSNSPLYGTCTYTTRWSKTVTRSDNACASDNYTTRFTYKVKGGETYVKALVANYADSYNQANAQYQPIFVSAGGYITSSPYAEPTNPDIKRYVGAMHIHTKRSGDNPYGTHPAATFSWFSKKGYDWLAMTDHNRVSTDVKRPRPSALKSMSVKKGGKVKLPFTVRDASSVKAFIKIKNSRGKVVKSVKAGWRKPNTATSKTITADLKRGTYKWGITATDSSLNPASYTSWKYLTVK